MLFAMASSARTKTGVFGPDAADIEFRAKSTWVMLRGNRYQALEGEFYRYVLEPRDDVLREVYGASSDDIAEGFQAMVEALLHKSAEGRSTPFPDGLILRAQ